MLNYILFKGINYISFIICKIKIQLTKFHNPFLNLFITLLKQIIQFIFRFKLLKSILIISKKNFIVILHLFKIKSIK